MGKHWGQPSGRGKRRNCGPFFLWFWWEGTDEAWQAGIRLANLSNFCGFWNIGAILNCLVPGYRVMRKGIQRARV